MGLIIKGFEIAEEIIRNKCRRCWKISGESCVCIVRPWRLYERFLYELRTCFSLFFSFFSFVTYGNSYKRLCTEIFKGVLEIWTVSLMAGFKML